MTIEQILNQLTFPISICIESENFNETFDVDENLGNRFKGYSIEKLESNTNVLKITLIKLPTLEELGYSFESGV
jgi:hypothetical protein